MGNFALQHEGFESSTSVPNCFIEKYMPTAAGEFVKIYIYLLKCVNENCRELSISRIADVFNNTEKDTIRALKYWEKRGLLKLSFEDGVLTSLALTSVAEMSPRSEEDDSANITVNVASYPAPGSKEEQQAKTARAQAKAARNALKASSGEAAPPSGPEMVVSDLTDADLVPAEAVPQKAVPQKRQYSRAEIDSFSDTEDIPQLIYIIQKYLGRALTGADMNTILFFYDTLKFPADLIEYLFEYCLSKGHKSMRYIEKTAVGWAEDGIRDVAGAKLLNGIYLESCYPVMKAFGLTGRNPAKSEINYVNKWILSYGFSMDMITDACGRTISAIHQPSFEYADSILRNWRSAGITSPEEVQKADDAFARNAAKKSTAKKSSARSATARKQGDAPQTAFNNFHQRSYDYAELETRLLNS